MSELAIIEIDIIEGELVDDDFGRDSCDDPGLCRGDGAPCDDYRCCISS